MIKITEELADQIGTGEGFGHVSEFGAVIGNAEFIIYFPDNSTDVYLAHISEFEQEGFLVRLKKS